MAAEPGSSHPATRLSSDLIFLSFAGADRARVEPVAAALRARGASVWYDAGSTAGGGNYVESMQRALRRAGALLVFVSAASVNSAWVADEVRSYRSLMAREPGHKLLVIHLDRTRAPMALAGVDSVDARDAQPETAASWIASALANPALISAQFANATSPRLPSVAPTAPAPMSPPPQKPSVAQPQNGAVAPVATGQVFVSYARSDRDRVQPLAEALRARGVTVWNDSGLAHGSRGWVETARSALDQSQTLIVAVSAASVASPWVMDDVRAFQSLKTRDPGRALVAVHLDKTRAPLSLASAHVIDAQSLGPTDTAGLIAGSLPASATQRAAEPTPSPAPPAPPVAATVPVTEAAPVAVAAVAAVALTPEPSVSNGATMPAAAPVEPPPIAQPAVASPEPVVAVAVEPPPAPAPEAPAAAPATLPEMAPAGLTETMPAPVVKPADAVVASPTLAEKSAEVKGSGRAGEAVALLVVLLIAIAIAWSLSLM
ncbi:MAG TPA: TIR domain-containing protein [Ktedonobacterales bacterium]|nr:TIR domain-containing protein [Ktedonobacterales bacterium]